MNIEKDYVRLFGSSGNVNEVDYFSLSKQIKDEPFQNIIGRNIGRILTENNIILEGKMRITWDDVIVNVKIVF